MILLKGLPIYKEFQSNTTVAPKPATNQNHLGSFLAIDAREVFKM